MSRAVLLPLPVESNGSIEFTVSMGLGNACPRGAHA